MDVDRQWMLEMQFQGWRRPHQLAVTLVQLTIMQIGLTPANATKIKAYM